MKDINSSNGPAGSRRDIERLREKARKLKRESSVTHGEAHEMVAREAGFATWHQALTKLADPGPGSGAQGTREVGLSGPITDVSDGQSWPEAGSAADEKAKEGFLKRFGLEDPLDYRIFAAAFEDDPQPPTALWRLSDEQLTAHAQSCLDQQQAMGLSTSEVRERRDLARAIAKTWMQRPDATSEDKVKVFEMLTTHQSRGELPIWAARKAIDGRRHTLVMKDSRFEVSVEKRMDAEDLAIRFILKRPTGPMAKATEWISAKGEQVPHGTVFYEAGWGFLTEGPGGWTFYHRDVWRRKKGWSALSERFVDAWYDDGRIEAEKASGGEEWKKVPLSQRKFMLVMDDPEGACMQIWALGDVNQRMAARQWMGQVFLPIVWPRMLSKALSRNYRFGENSMSGWAWSG